MIEKAASRELVPIDVAAAFLACPHRTLRTWIRRGKVRAACDVRTRRLLVDVLDPALRRAA